MKNTTNILKFEPATAIIDYNVTDNAIAELCKEYAVLKASDKDSYKLVTQALSVVRGLRTGVEKKRTEYKADSLEYGRRIDAEAKRVTALLEEIETPLKLQKEAYDAEEKRIKAEKEKLEQERIARILERIDRIKNAPFKHQGKSAKELQDIITAFHATIANTDFDYAEFKPKAEEEISSTRARLNSMLQQQIQAEELAEERKKLEAEKAKLEEEKRIAAEKTLQELNAKKQQELSEQEKMIISIGGATQLIAEHYQKFANDFIETTSEAVYPKIYKFPEKEAPKISDITIDNFNQIVEINQEFLDKLHEANNERASEGLAKALVQIEAAKTENAVFPFGKPTYNELVIIIEKMIKMLNCNTQEDFEFLEKIIKMLKFTKGE